MLPPAKLLRQNFIGHAFNFRLCSAFDVISSDPCRLMSPCLSRPSLILCESFFQFNSLCPHHWEAFKFLDIRFAPSFCSSSRTIQSTRFRYFCIRNWVVRWSPCALGTSHRTLCSLFDVTDDLSCGGRSWYAFELKPTAVLGRSSMFSNPACFKIGVQFFIVFSPVYNRFQLVHQDPTQLAQCLHATRRSPNLLNLQFALLDGPCCHFPAHFSRDELWSEFLVQFFGPCDWHFLTVQWLCKLWPEIFVCHVLVT